MFSPLGEGESKAVFTARSFLFMDCNKRNMETIVVIRGK